jgi:hypothetical protein
MTRRLLSVTAWLAAGHALLLGAFWMLLQVPESSAAMLLLSVLIVATIVAAVGWVEGAGLCMWIPETSPRQAMRRALPGPVPAIIGLIAFGSIWMLTGQAGAAWSGHKGEIDAWLLLHLGWTRTAGLHATAARLMAFVRFVVGGLIALTILGWALVGGLRALAHVGRWLAAALAPRRVVLSALLFYGLVWLPWKAVYWRPAWLAPNWQEGAFTVVKLGTLYLVANIGWAAILFLVKQGATGSGKLGTENEEGQT